MRRGSFLLLAGMLSAQSQPRLTDQRIVDLIATGVSEGEILRLIQTSPKFDFDLRPPSTDAMLQAGVSEEIMKAMAAREVGQRHRIPSSMSTDPEIRPLALPPPVAPLAASPVPLSGSAVSMKASSSKQFDQLPVPIYAPLPELASGSTVAQAEPTFKQDLASSAYTLSDQQVQKLIEQGTVSAQPLGITFDQFQTGLIADSRCSTCQQSGHPIAVYTREEWIQLAARNAKQLRQPFSAADVSFTMRMPLIYVSVPLSMPQPERNQISLKNSSGRSTIQPVELPNGAIESSNAFQLASFGTAAKAFQVSDLQALSAADAKAEVYIMLATNSASRYFRVDPQYVRELSMAAIATLPAGAAVSAVAMPGTRLR